MTETSGEIPRIVESDVLARPLGGTAILRVQESDVLTMVEDTDHSDAQETIRLEPFGDEESYWTVFRLFTAGRNLGRIWTVDEIWEYLAKNYDMSEETPATIEQTVLEWGEDICTDAVARGIDGRLLHYDGGYVFAMLAGSGQTEPVEPIEVQSYGPESRPAKRERQTPQQQLAYVVRGLIASMPSAQARQADIKKEILSAYPDYDLSRIQDEIDAMALDETIYKFRRKKVAYLSLVERPDEDDVEEPSAKEKHPKHEEIDIDVARKVLVALCAPRRHVQQKIMINDLWRMVNNVSDRSVRPPDDQIEALKDVCRQLQDKGLVVAASEKIGTGGVKTAGARSMKRKRSGTRQVFKVGLTNQQVKEELQANLFAQFGVQEYMEGIMRLGETE